MLIGFATIFLIGIIWMFVGIVYGHSTKDKDFFVLFMVSFYLFYAVISLGCPYLLDIIIPSCQLLPSLSKVSCEEFFNLSIFIVPSALFSSAGFFMFSIAIRRGASSVAWGIMQSAIVLPFLMTWLIFNDKVNFMSIAGIIAILLSLYFIVKGRQYNGQNIASESKSKTFIVFAFAAFLGNGLSQICSLLPNKVTMMFSSVTSFSNELMAWRVPITALSGLLVWGIIAYIVKMKVSLKQWKNGLTYAVIVFIGQTLLYIAIDILSKYKLSGIVYPLAMGCCVVLFSLFCIIFRHEKLHYFEKIGLVILTLGLFTQAIATIF